MISQNSKSTLRKQKESTQSTSLFCENISTIFALLMFSLFFACFRFFRKIVPPLSWEQLKKTQKSYKLSNWRNCLTRPNFDSKHTKKTCVVFETWPELDYLMMSEVKTSELPIWFFRIWRNIGDDLVTFNSQWWRQ